MWRENLLSKALFLELEFQRTFPAKIKKNGRKDKFLGFAGPVFICLVPLVLDEASFLKTVIVKMMMCVILLVPW